MQDFQRQRKRRNRFKNKKAVESGQTGFTLIEVLIVVAILGLLAVVLFFFFQRHLMRSRDVTRKSDIDRIKVAFEEYYNDHRCYPPPSMLNDCGMTGGEEAEYPEGSGHFYPHLYSYYLKSIPCDPLTNQPYRYFSKDGDVCDGYRLLAALEITDDPDITRVGCSIEQGCGWEEYPDYNYGIAMGGGLTGEGWVEEEIPDEEEPPEGEGYYCVPEGPVYVCDTLTAQEIEDYFLPPVDYSCKEFDTLSACEVACVSEGQLDPGVACVCKENIPYCQ